MIQVGNIYNLDNGLKVLIEYEEGTFSDMPWDFTGRDTTFKNYYHFRSNGRCHEGEKYNISSDELNK